MSQPALSLPASAARFETIAAERGVAIDIKLTPEPARSAEQAAAACGCSTGEIVKSLIFRGERSAEPLLFLVSGSNRLDEARAAAEAGEPIVRADAAFVREATGYAIGGIPPFGHARPARAFIDAGLMSHRLVWAAAGHPCAVFPVAPDDLLRLTQAKVMTPAAAAPDAGRKGPA